jgi:hypothetical protein
MNARPQSEYPLCRHIKTNGRRCQSPTRAHSAFCCHHQRHHPARPCIIDANPALSAHVLHPLHNARSIQHALSMVLSALANNQLRPSLAGKMLYALQLASDNLRKPQ